MFGGGEEVKCCYMGHLVSLCIPSRSSSVDSLLLAAIRHQLTAVVDKMCDIGIDVKAADQKGNTALWIALRSRQEAIAKQLVTTIHGCY